MLRECRLVVFDCDGTLVDSQHSILAAMREAWRELGLPEPDHASVRRVVGLSLPAAAAHLMPDGDEELWEEAARRYRAAFARHRQEGRPADPLFPGVQEGLAALERAGLLLGMATGKSRRGLRSTLGEHGIRDHFATLQTSDDAPSKPHPGMILRAMEQTGSEPAQTVMVGDTTYDMQAALGAGASALGVAWGYHEPAELREAGALHVVESFEELTRTILEGAVR